MINSCINPYNWPEYKLKLPAGSSIIIQTLRKFPFIIHILCYSFWSPEYPFPPFWHAHLSRHSVSYLCTREGDFIEYHNHGINSFLVQSELFMTKFHRNPTQHNSSLNWALKLSSGFFNFLGNHLCVSLVTLKLCKQGCLHRDITY